MFSSTQLRRLLPSITRGMAVRILADAALIVIALAAAVTARLLFLLAFQKPAGEDAMFYVEREMRNFFRSSIPLTTICLILFWFSGFYNYGKSYTGKYRWLFVAQSVALGFLLYAFLEYFATGGTLPIARTALPLGWLFATVLLVGARVWSDTWKRIVVPERDRVLTAQTNKNRVLVIGGGGYIGSALLPQLLDRGYKVRLLDLLLFGKAPIDHLLDHPNLDVIKGDFRNVVSVYQAMQDMGAVVHLGAIVGDPACNLDEDLTIDVNLISTRMVAEIARSAGVERFIFASSCSVYGASDDWLDERSTVQPVSLYGHTKLASEQVLQELSDPSFKPTILRFATIYGQSGRTRFDLVVNLLTAKAKLDGEITVHGGDQWRPFIHVEDAALAIACVLDAPQTRVGDQIYNVGSNTQNYTITEIAELIHERVVDATISTSTSNADHRDYRVVFDKLQRDVNFSPRWSVADGIQQVLEAIAAGEVTDYTDPQFSNARFLTEEGTTKFARDQWARALIRDQTNN